MFLKTVKKSFFNLVRIRHTRTIIFKLFFTSLFCCFYLFVMTELPILLSTINLIFIIYLLLFISESVLCIYSYFNLILTYFLIVYKFIWNYIILLRCFFISSFLLYLYCIVLYCIQLLINLNVLYYSLFVSHSSGEKWSLYTKSEFQEGIMPYRLIPSSSHSHLSHYLNTLNPPTTHTHPPPPRLNPSTSLPPFHTMYLFPL
jgi:hypothetical protein